MKIISREQKIREYNVKHPNRPDDSLECVKRYFSDKGLNLEKACEKASKKVARIIAERSYETIHIVLYEEPFATPRPRVTKSGRAFSPNASANKDYIVSAIGKIMETMKLISSPAEIRIEAYLEMPSNVPPDEVILFESKVLHPITKPDYDNIGKCYTDMLTGVVISDDDMFYKAEIVKYYSLLPRVEITITYLAKNESDYIYKKLKTRKTIKEGIESGRVVLEKLSV